MKSREVFNWRNGNVPECKIHSRVKLDILRSYLLDYFQTVSRNPRMDYVNIHLVDAFCGGGVFRDSQTGNFVSGSPLVMMQTVADAEHAIAAGKTKPFKIKAQFHFADKSRDAIERLRSAIGFQDRFGEEDICLDNLPFQKYLPRLLKRIPSRERTKAIFFLDQTGWNHATLLQCNQILKHLPKAEIIWNINIESLAMFANEDEDFRAGLARFGVDLGDAFSAKKSFNLMSDWRKALVAHFLTKIRGGCTAKYVSPFMVQHDGWGYWLLHLSNHSEANNVMKATHWRHQNSSLHEGFPGLRMLEFNRENWNQATIWRFDDDARNATHEALLDELCPRIREIGEEPTVQELFDSIANETPADRDKLFVALEELKKENILRIIGPNDETRRSRPQSTGDRLLLSTQRNFFMNN